MQPANYRLAQVNHHHMSRQSQSLQPHHSNYRQSADDVNTQQITRQSAYIPNRGCISSSKLVGEFDEKSFSRLNYSHNDVCYRQIQEMTSLSSRRTAIQKSSSSSQLDPRYRRQPPSASATSSSSVTSRPVSQLCRRQFGHYNSSSAPETVDKCPSYLPKQRHQHYDATVPSTSSVLCVANGVPANTVTVRTEYHLTTSRSPLTSSYVTGSTNPKEDDQRSCSVWIGQGQLSDVRVLMGIAKSYQPDRNGEKCISCRRLISDGKTAYIAHFKRFHDCCFTCTICRRRLRTGSKYYIVNDKLYCEMDYVTCYGRTFKSMSETCVVCNDVITDYMLRAMGKCYHVNCFRCVICHQQLSHSSFTIDFRSFVYCLRDYISLYAPKCAVCKQAVISSSQSKDGQNIQRFVVSDNNYHAQCFRCQSCGVSLMIDDDADNQQLTSHCLQQQQQPLYFLMNNKLLCYSCHHYHTHHNHFYAPLSTTNNTELTWNDVGGVASDDEGVAYGDKKPLLVDVTLDGDASSTCTSDDAATSTTSDDTGSDVIDIQPDQHPQQERILSLTGKCSSSVDSGHCSGASDDPMTSSDTETLDAESDVNDDVDSAVTSTLGRETSDSSTTLRHCDNLSILELLAETSRVTEL